MSRYRKIDPRIWNDAKFRSLDNQAKLVFFMLLTHPSMTALGAMRATLPGLAAEIGWALQDLEKALSQLLARGMAEHDEAACLMALPNFIRYNRPESPNVIKAWVGSIHLLPESDLKTLVINRAQVVAEGMSEGFRYAFYHAFPHATPNQEQEREQEQEQEQQQQQQQQQQERTANNLEGCAIRYQKRVPPSTYVSINDIPLAPHEQEQERILTIMRATFGQWLGELTCGDHVLAGIGGCRSPDEVQQTAHDAGIIADTVLLLER